MNDVKLSYVITTFNKLPYLKQVMRLLLQNVQVDEEIVIADGGSSDGTKEYLQQLYADGLIHQFISEKDKGEAHGYNKTFLLAKGDLIKIITDDDIFNYEAIGKMKDFMLQNTHLDAICGNIISVNVTHTPTFSEYRKSYQVWFEQWTRGEIGATFFSCLPLMIRRNRLSLLGLFDTSYKHVDLEYSVRLTFNNRKLAFYSDLVAIGLVNEKSVSAQEVSYTTILQTELKRLQGNFNYVNRKGLETISTPWIRRAFFHKHFFLWKFADKFKLFTAKKKYFPEYDLKLRENIEIPYTDIPALFKYFEQYFKDELLQTFTCKFISS